jgi:two-component SAPR family response regulator
MPDNSRKLEGLNVFVVEDEALVALNLEDMLDDLGCTVIGTAMRLAKAREMIDEGVDADVAILDVNIAGEPVFPIAEQLVSRGIPIVFATGYGQAGLPTTWHDNPILQKPYTLEEVSCSLEKATGRG